RAAVLPDGSVTPCPMTRWMDAGSVHQAPLSEIIASVTTLAATLPRMPKCYPDECMPDLRPCRPDVACHPDRRSPLEGSAARACAPDSCRPDVYCAPLCAPNPPCRPGI